MKYIKTYNEGVADKYAEREFNILDKTYNINLNTSSKGIYVGKIFDYSNNYTRIYKNPISLENYDHDVRAILLKNGDMYIQDKMLDVKHEDILAFLQMKNILNVVEGDNLEEILKNIMQSKWIKNSFQNFVSIERLNRTNIFETTWRCSDNYQQIYSEARRKFHNFKFALFNEMKEGVADKYAERVFSAKLYGSRSNKNKKIIEENNKLFND